MFCCTCKSEDNADDTVTFSFIFDVALTNAAYVTLYYATVKNFSHVLVIGQEVSRLIMYITAFVLQYVWDPAM